MMDRLRERVGALAIQSMFESLARAGKYWPDARRIASELDIVRNVPYGEDAPWHLLDVYRHKDVATGPALLYLHGGAFRILSKDTHWLMASMFARAGFVVFNANYRLAPTHKYPAALEDAALAYVWLSEHAPRFGGALDRLVVAGESAGANLALALTLCTVFQRPESFAQRVFETGLVPKSTLPICGILQVSDADRFARRKPHLSRIVADRLDETERGYIGGIDACHLADPLCILESEMEAARPIPAMYAAVGTADPLLPDTRRLAHALARRGVQHRVSYFPRELHAFHAILFCQAARTCWREQLAFLRETLGS